MGSSEQRDDSYEDEFRDLSVSKPPPSCSSDADYSSVVGPPPPPSSSSFGPFLVSRSDPSDVHSSDAYVFGSSRVKLIPALVGPFDDDTIRKISEMDLSSFWGFGPTTYSPFYSTFLRGPFGSGEFDPFGGGERPAPFCTINSDDDEVEEFDVLADYSKKARKALQFYKETHGDDYDYDLVEIVEHEAALLPPYWANHLLFTAKLKDSEKTEELFFAELYPRLDDYDDICDDDAYQFSICTILDPTQAVKGCGYVQGVPDMLHPTGVKFWQGPPGGRPLSKDYKKTAPIN